MKSKKKAKAARRSVKPNKRSARLRKDDSPKRGLKQAAGGRLAGRDRQVVKASAEVKGAARCGDCGAVYYDKHWHSAELVPAKVRTGGLAKKKCDVCRAGAAYAGEVLIEGVADQGERAEIAALVRNIGKRATLRDPEERIVRLHDDGSSLRIFTSENQLAVSIGKQVDQARKGGRLDIVWSADDKPVRVHWHAPKKGNK
ncbi:MAG: hypothetical protein PHT12_06485 [Patescibacteria group bacterium]|nr:hypothetical protein [Patescibacteria group bacterium]